jgi:hypothetical protein
MIMPSKDVSSTRKTAKLPDLFSPSGVHEKIVGGENKMAAHPI